MEKKIDRYTVLYRRMNWEHKDDPIKKIHCRVTLEIFEESEVFPVFSAIGLLIHEDKFLETYRECDTVEAIKANILKYEQVRARQSPGSVDSLYKGQLDFTKENSPGVEEFVRSIKNAFRTREINDEIASLLKKE